MILLIQWDDQRYNILEMGCPIKNILEMGGLVNMLEMSSGSII